MMPGKARDIMTANPSCCTPEDTVQAAARVMKERDCGCVPVVENENRGRLLGVVTDRDIAMRVVEPGSDAKRTRVSQVMTPDPVCCTADAELEDVERLMQEHRVRRVPIVDGEGTVVGVVAQADLAVRGYKEKHAVGEREVAETVERISEPTRHPGGTG
jgi:CBS domain-containing protein